MATSWSLMAGLSELRDGSVQAGAGIRLGHSEHACDLGVRETAGELERDQVALLSIQRRERRAYGLAPQRELGLVLGCRGDGVLGIDLEHGAALALSQLVESGVASDAEQPGVHRAASGPVGAPLPVGALERLGGHVLRGGPVA